MIAAVPLVAAVVVAFVFGAVVGVVALSLGLARASRRGWF